MSVRKGTAVRLFALSCSATSAVGDEAAGVGGILAAVCPLDCRRMLSRYARIAGNEPRAKTASVDRKKKAGLHSRDIAFAVGGGTIRYESMQRWHLPVLAAFASTNDVFIPVFGVTSVGEISFIKPVSTKQTKQPSSAMA